ncbi:MAG TPA: metallophosphoesterase [Tepidisphaeraceae bacterium]|jgi:serine/threonine protein phosphatase 1|nr:metallophosphoesterase [Tepidisphaeraceae bacterium]
MRWVIGDIHGMLRPLDALLKAVEKRDAAARFIFCGDYVNRGPEAPGVINRMLGLSNATFLRGNHDDIFDLIVNGECFIGHKDTPDALSAFRWFMNHGLADTLVAYGAQLAELEFLMHHPDAARLNKLVAIVPEAHRKFFRALRPLVEYDQFFVAHAYWDVDFPDVGMTALLAADVKLRYQILWGRFSEAQLQKKKRWRRTGYFGHTPVTNYRKTGDAVPVTGPNIVLLDTGVALGVFGRLTAVCADSGEMIQADRAGAILA